MIAEHLRALGLAAGDTVMLHVSLRRVNHPDGAAGLLHDIEDVIGPSGTTLMILGMEDDYDWVNDHPEDRRPELLRDAPVIDVAGTPPLAEVGKFAVHFWRAPGTTVGTHPDARFAARGPRAEALLQTEPLHNYYGPGSPLERLIECGGRVLRLGANDDTVTVLHYAEAICDVAEKRVVRRTKKVAEGEFVTIQSWDDSEGIVDHPGDDYFAQIVRAYRAAGRPLGVGQVGEARAELFDAADVVDFARSWMEDHFNHD